MGTSRYISVLLGEVFFTLPVLHSFDLTPFCSSRDEDEAAQLLIDHGANVNCTNKKGATPLLISALKGTVSVLKLLLRQPSINIHLQVTRTGERERRRPYKELAEGKKTSPFALFFFVG